MASEVKLAEALGVSRSMVRRRIKLGMPVTLHAARRWTADNVETKNAPHDDDGDAATTPSSKPTLTESRRRLVELKANQLERMEKRERGLLLDAAMVTKIYLGTIRPVVASLRGIARKLAPRVARESNPSACERLILDAIDESLYAVSKPHAIETMLSDVGVPEDLGQKTQH